MASIPTATSAGEAASPASESHHRPGTGVRINLALMAVASMLAGAGFFMMPIFNDDIWYSWFWRPWLEGRDQDILHTALTAIKDKYLWENARLGNVLMIFNVFIPHWIFHLISTIALFAIYRLGAALGGFLRSMARCTLWVGAFLVIFPWIDQIYLIDFQINYLWTTAMALGVVYMLLKGAGSDAALWGLGLLTALWHEAFGASLICAVVALMLIYPGFRCRRVQILLVALAIGVAYLYAPRIGQPSRIFFSGRAVICLPFVLPAVAFAGMLTWKSLKAKKLKPSPLMLVLLTCSVVNAGFLLLFPFGPRVASLSVTAALIGIVKLLPGCRRGWVRIGAITVSWALIIWHLVVVDMICYHSGRETRRVIAQYQANPDAVVFSDLPLRVEAPWIALQKPYYEWFAHKSNTFSMTHLYSIGYKWINVAPKDLENFSPKDVKPVPGTAGVGLFGSRYVLHVPRHNRDVHDVMLEVSYAGKPQMRPFYVVPFWQEADGSWWLWLHPDNSSVHDLLHRRPDSISKPTPHS